MPPCSAHSTAAAGPRAKMRRKRPAISTMLTGAESTPRWSCENDTPRAKTACNGERSHLGVIVRVASKQGKDVARQNVPFRQRSVQLPRLLFLDLSSPCVHPRRLRADDRTDNTQEASAPRRAKGQDCKNVDPELRAGRVVRERYGRAPGRFRRRDHRDAGTAAGPSGRRGTRLPLCRSCCPPVAPGARRPLQVYCAQVTLEQFSTRARRGGTAQGDQFPRTEQLIFEIVLVVHLGLPRPARPRPTKPTVLPVP
jgi:hypothetical protein